MSAPLISVCIATRNRAGYLAETVESIAAQADGSVEIVVLDGASTDETPAVVARLQQRHGCIRYRRETRNGGIDQDFDLAVQTATGRYCWLMSDDDLLRPGAVAAVTAALGAGHCLVIVNAEIRDDRLDELIEARHVERTGDRVYGAEEQEALLVDLANYLSFIGCVVIERELWLARQRAPYYGTLFVHVGVIFQQALPASACFIAEPLITIRFGNASWTRRAFEIWMFKWPTLIWSFEHLSAAARRAVYHPEPWRRLDRLFLYRARGAYGRAEYAERIRPRAGSALFRALSRAITWVPPALANLAVYAYCMLRWPRFRLAMWDLRNSPYFLPGALRRGLLRLRGEP